MELKLLGPTCCGRGWIPLRAYVATISAALASLGYASLGKQYFPDRPSTERSQLAWGSILAGFDPNSCHCVQTAPWPFAHQRCEYK